MIDTQVPGDPASVQAAAGWLRHTLASNTEKSGDQQADTRSFALSAWEGAAADGYRSATSPVIAATDNHAARIKRAATALDEYAARMSRLDEAMGGIRGRAAAGGLTVYGTIIMPPPPVLATFVVPGSPEEAAHQVAVEKVNLYNELAVDADGEWQAFSGWSDAHLAAALTDARDTDDVDALTDTFTEHIMNAIPGAGLGVMGLALSKTADSYRSAATEFRRRSRVAGDPRIRGSADTPSGSSHLDDLMGRSRLLGHAGKLMGPLGIGVDLYSGYQEGQESGDWTRAALTTGASIGTGLAVAGLVAAGVVSAPAVVVVVGGAALAAGVAWGVGEVYDHWDDIENWTGDRVDDVTGLASDAWDGATEAAGDTWDGAKDLAGDAWDSATPW